MAWTKEASFSNTGSVISSIYRNWEDFSLNWDSLSPNEDFEPVGASSSELITFGYQIETINVDWEDYNRPWDSTTFASPLTATTSNMVSELSGFLFWENYNSLWEDKDLDWDKLFPNPEEVLRYINFRFNEIDLTFNRWNKYFGNKGSLWNDDTSISNNLYLDTWNSYSINWEDVEEIWNSYSFVGAEEKKVTALALNIVEEILNVWEESDTKWESKVQGWSSLAFNKEDTTISTLSSTSNIVPMGDFNAIDTDWEDIDSTWESMYLGGE